MKNSTTTHSNRCSPSVLIVDGVRRTRHLLTQHLADRGYAVVAVWNPYEALEAAKLHDFSVAYIGDHAPGYEDVDVTLMLRAYLASEQILHVSDFDTFWIPTKQSNRRRSRFSEAAAVVCAAIEERMKSLIHSGPRGS